MKSHIYCTASILLICTCISSGNENSSVFEPVRQKSHTQKIHSGRLEYSIDMGGTVDMDNTTTRLYATFDIAFQNNISLTMENTGNTTVKNPRIITNDKRRWWCIEEMLDEILADARSDQEKAFFIFDFVRSNRHHDDPIFRDKELHDPVKVLNVFGAGLCDDSGSVGCSLFYHAGLNEKKFGRNPIVRTLHGHMICEAVLSDGYQFLDIDENTFYLDLENELPVSGDTIVNDHYLAKREHVYGPIFRGWRIGEDAASLFGRDDGSTIRTESGHRIEFDLRPGEMIIYRWDNCGKFASDDSEQKRGRRFWGTSKWIYEPVLTDKRIKADTKEASDEYLIYEMKTLYAVCGGNIKAEFARQNQDDHFGVFISLNGRQWKKVWQDTGTGNIECNVNFDEALEYKKAPPRYAYFVKISAKKETIKSLRIESDIMTSPHALPRLSLGKNKIEYTDDTKEPHEISVEYLWLESDSIKPPAPPQQPITPGDRETVRATTVPFKWPAGKQANRYHIRLCRRQDMKLIYRPSFDVIINSSEHHCPFAGMFNPDEQYYWQIRVCNRQGVWGKWSNVWKFKWQGPRIPVNLNSTIEKQNITISWQPNPRGERPVEYEVYGSNERGFTPSKDQYEVLGLGTQPSNLLCTTTDTKLLVVSPDATKPAMNCSFYRVIAIDENGVASGPSELLELPHPFIYSKPVTKAEFNKLYNYQAMTLNCIGDLQFRYAKPNKKFWEKEGYEFELTEKPAWLTVDKNTGLLSGTPADKDKGTHRVTIVCHRTFPYELKEGDYRPSPFLKNDPRFKAKHQQSFDLSVR
ncbi:MAG: hypothetical protein JW837_16350 [Sedimentisphaerales bacterium]|nr:hypothetical protein [Sedimentisphaerales bacterium]